MPAPNPNDESLSFRHKGQVVRLSPGDVFSAPAGDSYHDAPASDLIGIVAEIEAGRAWREAVAARYASTNPWLHKIVTSPTRDLFFRQYPTLARGRILDVGSGWGQLALPLAAHGTVCALEPTPERLQFIRAVARQEGVDGAMWFLNADVFDVLFDHPFDLALCIGVLEWVPKFRPGSVRAVQLEFLQRLRAALAPGGHLVIGIENRLGLKYLLGAPDDHVGYPGVGVYDHELAERKWRAISGQDFRASTHTRSELDEILAEAGFGTRQFFGAFPDYKLPQVILPLGPSVEEFVKTQHIEEHDGSNGVILPIQEEIFSHYRSLADLKIASNFVPSFFVVATVSPPPFP